MQPSLQPSLLVHLCGAAFAYGMICVLAQVGSRTSKKRRTSTAGSISSTLSRRLSTAGSDLGILDHEVRAQGVGQEQATPCVMQGYARGEKYETLQFMSGAQLCTDLKSGP
jgi:hypothetical protein